MKAGTPVVRCSPREDKDLGTTKHRGSRIETNLRETMHLAKQMMSVPDDLFDQDPGINCMLLMTFRRLLPDCFCSQGNDRSGRVLQTKKEMPTNTTHQRALCHASCKRSFQPCKRSIQQPSIPQGKIDLVGLLASASGRRNGLVGGISRHAGCNSR